MLQKLYIRNYAIIDEVTLEFDKQLNVITGETGAGKSILLGALSLILGERADTSALINQEEKCVVEAFFEVGENEAFSAALQAQEIDFENICIIRREISVAGKSRAFINDTPVTLNVLHTLTSMLVDLHRQFDTRAVLEHDFRFEVLDAMADTQEAVRVYTGQYRSYKALQAALQQLRMQQEQRNSAADYKQFLLDELSHAAFKENEIEETEASLKALTHAEQIKSTLHQAHYALELQEAALNNELKRILQQLQSLNELQPETLELSKRIESAWLELRDIADEIDVLQSKVDMNPEQLAQMEERVGEGYRLMKKHQVTTTAELIALQQQLEAELADKNNVEEKITALQSAAAESEAALQQAAMAISKKRQKAAGPFAEKVNELLHLVGMPNAVFKTELEAVPALHELGMDKPEFILDANKSGRFQPIQKAASGGELSRIMLSIKTLTANAMELPTLIFDEVDTGISGEAARQVGILLRSVGQYHQVICITHQPQVAGKGTRHFYVYKSAAADGKIKTKVRVLNDEEHVRAIAEMIGGEQPSEAALRNARELVNG